MSNWKHHISLCRSPIEVIPVAFESLRCLPSPHQISEFSHIYNPRYEFLNPIGTNCPVKISGHYILPSLKEISSRNFVRLGKEYLIVYSPLYLGKDFILPLGFSWKSLIHLKWWCRDSFIGVLHQPQYHHLGTFIRQHSSFLFHSNSYHTWSVLRIPHPTISVSM